MSRDCNLWQLIRCCQDSDATEGSRNVGCKRLQMVVKVPAGALRPTSGNPCHRSYEPHSCLELSFSSWQFGEPYGQAKPLMPVLGMLAVPERYVRELMNTCRSAFSLLLTDLMPEKVPNRGTKQNRFPG